MSGASAYWEERARRFSGDGEGLRAVCAYGMPGFYNRAIASAQRRALAPWLDVAPETRVLDVGCGVGRWSRRLAGRGAHVTGVDLSPTMLAEAARRAEAEGVAGRCRFRQGDVSQLDLGEAFPLVLVVTVLQHVVSGAGFSAALASLARHVAPGGRLVLLEAAPPAWLPAPRDERFAPRSSEEYLAALGGHGLRPRAVTGVDPLPLKILFLPAYRRLPRALALAGLAGCTLLSLPVELLLGRRWASGSWHKVMVLERPTSDR